MAAHLIFGRILLLIVLVAGKYINGLNNGTENNRSGLTGAVPEEKLVYKKAIACQSQKLFISCPDIYDRIQIKESFYGREDFITCKHPKLTSDKICAEQNTSVNKVVNDLCRGEVQCEISVTNDFLAKSGTIICPDIYKYLYVKYRCVPKSSLENPSEMPYDTGIPSNPSQGVSTPVQCCYVVPAVIDTHQSAASSVGGTIVRHVGGTQSVEERIVSEHPHAVPQLSRITEVIHSLPGLPPSITYPIVNPNQPPENGAPTQGPTIPATPTQPASTPTTSTPNATPSITPTPAPTSPGTTSPSATPGGTPKPTVSPSEKPRSTATPTKESTSANPKVLAQMKLIALLKQHAKGLGLSISFEPSRLTNAVAKRNKIDFVPRPLNERKKQFSRKFLTRSISKIIKNRKLKHNAVTIHSGYKKTVKRSKSAGKGTG